MIAPGLPGLAALLDHLAATPPAAPGRWGPWQITPIAGGANNLLYRATGPAADLAVKFTIRDARDRAGREYRALQALAQAGLDLAPRAVWLDQDRYPQPVVVQTWLPGPVLADPPADDAGWHALLAHLLAIHRLDPGAVAVPLAAAVLEMTSAASGLARVKEQQGRIPGAAQLPAVQAALARVADRPWPAWPPPRLGLCRCDPNTLNFVRRPGAWASVDWENAGWGDPAFEIADLLAHPAYQTIPAARHAWVVATYARQAGDPGAAERIAVYYLLTLAWWVARLARTLYEVPRGLEVERLAPRAPTWAADTRAKLAAYLARLEALLATV